MLRPHFALRTSLDVHLSLHVFQVEAQLAIEEDNGIANQQQAEMLQDSESNEQPDIESSKQDSQDAQDAIPSTLQYLAQQADINHAFQQEVNLQRQEKSEL